MTLRANDDETNTCREFTLGGIGQTSSGYSPNQRAGYWAFPASSGRARSANCGINAVEGCERETRGLPAAAIFSLWKIVAQLPHLWRIFVAPILAALAMVNHSCDGLVPY
jgi:hypothetical protein